MDTAQGIAPPMSRLGVLPNPQVHSAADVHEFSLIEGAVNLGAGTVVAPGVAITAASDATVIVNEDCSLLPGVLIEGVGGAQVMTPALTSCSVWVGINTVIAHKAIVHSPAFVGQKCFIGLRSTVFNARLGDGCVVMMHALVQDVEVPPGKCVPSGSIVTTQHQADQLPDVRPEDLEFVKEIMGSAAYRSTTSLDGRRSETARAQPRSAQPRSAQPRSSAQSRARLVPINQSSAAQPSVSDYSNSQSNQTSYARAGANMQTTHPQAKRLSPDVVQQVRQYLSQGYRIGMEHADARRYRSGVWETCTPIKDTREQVVFEGLERCLAEHSGEYVRMFGIDPKAKRRVGMATVQRPDGRPVSVDARSVAGSSASNGAGAYTAANSTAYAPNSNGSHAGGGLTPEVVQEVRNLLRGGYVIGTEHADARRYRSNVWKSCSPIKSSNEQEVLSRLDHCLAEHSGEYVRMFGIDANAKQRMASITIQKADGSAVSVSPSRAAAASAAAGSPSYGGGSQAGYSPSGYGQSSYGQSGGSSAAVTQVASQILAQGNQIGVEYADARRYRSGIWQTAPSVRSVGDLQSFLGQNAEKYVRIFAVNRAMKTRGAATTVQKPGQVIDAAPTFQGAVRDPINANPPHYDDPAFLKSGVSHGNGSVDAMVMNQVTQLVNQGCQISVEFADKRRFRSGIWQTGPAINARRPDEAITALGQQLAQHPNDYVRLVGVDPQAKRRVLETTIQRP
ncbi:MAG: acetyltransferase [Phormidesmis sp. RL_2_1]|nr:acetyltransferase [Phormidesmis sp. RL_2_1]